MKRSKQTSRMCKGGVPRRIYIATMEPKKSSPTSIPPPRLEKNDDDDDDDEIN